MIEQLKTRRLWYDLLLIGMRAGLVAALFLAGWSIYKRLPAGELPADKRTSSDATTVHIVIRRESEVFAPLADVTIDVYPIDIVAVRQEFFAERRAGERFDDFKNQRMKGRAPVTAKFDQHGEAIVALAPGNWWIYTTVAGDENLEWRLPVSVSGNAQTVELTSRNAYTRTKSF